MSRATDHAHQPLIWITDDSLVEAQFTERALGTDYRFEKFSDGSQVVERLAAGGQQPDVLLLDWVMPGMMGDEVCRFLRSQPATAELPIILVTASRVETADVVEGLTSGANDYVARPFVAEELRARVETALRAKRLRELANRERDRLTAIARLGRAFVEAGPRLEAVLDALVGTLVGGIADGCAIALLHDTGMTYSLVRHHSRRNEDALFPMAALADPQQHEFASSAEARATLPPAYHRAIDMFGMRSLVVIPLQTGRTVTGVVTVTRDGSSQPFEREDLETLHTCIDYAAIAIENARRFDAEHAARAQLDAVLENLPISVVLVGRDLEIKLANPAARAIMPSLEKHTVIDSLLPARVRTASGEDVPLAERPLYRALRGESVRVMELEIEAEGGDRFIRASAVPLRDGRGNVVAAVSAFEDVTQERAALEERERSIEFQQYVMGIVGHDLRNPLAAISMGCDLLKHEARDNAPIANIAERLGSSASRMQRIVEQLLDVTRARLGSGIPVDRREVNLEDVVHGVVDEMALAYPGRVFERKLEHVSGQWDPDRIAQVVSNLVGNAIQHGPSNTPVWIESSQEGDEALIRVRNMTVAGTQPVDVVTKHPLPRRRGVSERNQNGLGLGLYISNEIMRAHQGRISVESEHSMMTFTVRLPIQQAE